MARPFQVDAGTTLFRQGDPSDGLYLIKHGEIDILRRIPGDEAVRLAVLGRSAIVGEMSSLDHNPRSTHAVATLPTSGYFVSYERFQILQSDFSASAFAVMNCFRREVAFRTRTAIDEIAAFAGGAEPPPAAPARSGAAKWPVPSSPSTIDERVLQSLPFFRTFRLAELREFIEPLKRFDFTRGQLVYATGGRPELPGHRSRGAVDEFPHRNRRRDVFGSRSGADDGRGLRSWTAVRSRSIAGREKRQSHLSSVASSLSCCAKADPWWRSGSSKL